jgi:hypothetical protein
VNFPGGYLVGVPGFKLVFEISFGVYFHQVRILKPRIKRLMMSHE